MPTVRLNKISPATSTAVTLGDSGDTFTVPTGVTLDASSGAMTMPATVTVSTELKTNKISPGSSTAFTFGDSGDTFTIPSGVTIANSGTQSGFGDVVKLSTQTASSSASIEFTSGIDSTYREYVFRFYNINPDTNDKAFGFQVDTGGGYGVAITDTNFEAQHSEAGTGAQMNYAYWQDAAESTGHILLASALGSGDDEAASGEFHLFNPASTTYVKNFYATFQSYYESDYSRNAFTAGYVNTTSAVTGIKFYMTSGNIDGKIKMYGIK